MRLQMQVLALAIGISLGSQASAQVKPELSSAATQAARAITVNPALASVTSGDKVTAKSAVAGPNGAKHVRFERTFNGLPVIGGDFVVHTSGSGDVTTSTALATTKRPASIKPLVSAADAIVTAGALLPAGISVLPTSKLVVYARDVPEPLLAHAVRVSGKDTNGNPLDLTYYIDASNGKVLGKVSNLHTQRRELPPVTPTPALGSGKSYYLGTVPLNTTKYGGATGYQLLDQTRGGGTTLDARNRDINVAGTWAVPISDADNLWGSGTSADRSTAAVDAHYGVAATWDYYKDIHGRNGIFDDGVGVPSHVHVGVNYNNAGWNALDRAMYYGDGDGNYFLPLVALDVAGHEMSHGVVTATANLSYAAEPGGLNEATADIFGTMVERYIGLKTGRAYNWTIGEDLIGPGYPASLGKAMRYFFKPSLDGHSIDCYDAGTTGLVDVHYSSGVGNHFFYLLSEGATVPAGYDLAPADVVCNGDTALTGIGADAAQKIWYLALSAYFVSSTDYIDARIGTLQAAADLYGEGSPQHVAVGQAWSAVNVD